MSKCLKTKIAELKQQRAEQRLKSHDPSVRQDQILRNMVKVEAEHYLELILPIRVAECVEQDQVAVSVWSWDPTDQKPAMIAYYLEQMLREQGLRVEVCKQKSGTLVPLETFELVLHI